MHALMNALADRAQGHIDDTGLAKVANLHSLLHFDMEEKVAAPSTDAAATIGKRILESLGKGIEHSVGPAVTMTLAGLGVSAASAGGRALMNKATKNRDLESILEVYPHLKEWDRKEIELAYSSMRHMNPHIAKDPLAGGTLLGQMLRSRDPLNPKVLRFDPQLAGDLMRLSPKEEHAFEETARDAVMKGIGMGFEDASRSSAADKQRAFMEEQEKGRRAHETSRDAARAGEAERDRAWQARRDQTSRKAQMGLEAHKAKLKERSETGRRSWETGEKEKDRVSQDMRTVLSAMVGKAEMDRDFYAAPIMDPNSGQFMVDPATGNPMLDPKTGQPITDPATMQPLIDPTTGQPYAEHRFGAPPQISSVLGGHGNTSWVHKNYPHLRR